MTDLFVLQESEEIKSNKLDSELKLKETEFLQQQQEKSSQEEVLIFFNADKIFKKKVEGVNFIAYKHKLWNFYFCGYWKYSLIVH